MIYSLANY